MEHPRMFASNFNSATMLSGNRRDIFLAEGFKYAKTSIFSLAPV